MKNRSSWASGSGKVPSYSIGFCVAITRKGSGSWYVVPSTVTWCSSIASRRADWVFGVARLISSARTIWLITGPGRNSNAFVRWLKIDTPVTSEGSRSGVNWIRRNEQPSERERAFASTVFPVPGTSSTRMCPRQTSATRESSISWCFPKMTRSTLSTTPVIRATRALSTCSVPLFSLIPRPLAKYGSCLPNAKRGGLVHIRFLDAGRSRT